MERDPVAVLYRTVIEPTLDLDDTITHLIAYGYDGFRSVITIEDALADDVLVAYNLDGAPLSPDHGAPRRLVSPSQYGFVSVKHLAGFELHTSEPDENFGTASALGRYLMVRPLFARHPRSRVWQEERNDRLPPWLIRPVYRALTPMIGWLSARGGRPRPGAH